VWRKKRKIKISCPGVPPDFAKFLGSAVIEIHFRFFLLLLCRVSELSCRIRISVFITLGRTDASANDITPAALCRPHRDPATPRLPTEALWLHSTLTYAIRREDLRGRHAAGLTPLSLQIYSIHRRYEFGSWPTAACCVSFH
jgi:hypothetical protein